MKTTGRTITVLTLMAFCCLAAWETSARAEVYQYEDAFGTTHITNTPPDERYESVKLEDTVYQVEKSWHAQNDITKKLMQILKDLEATEVTVTVVQESKKPEEEIEIPEELPIGEVGGEVAPEERGLEEEEAAAFGLAAKKSWFGIQVTTIDRKLKDEYKLDSQDGLLVKDVAVNSPAEKSKIRIGDVITSITDMYNDETQIEGMDDLNKVLGEVTKEDRIRFTINRKGNLYILLLAVGERPSKLAKGEWY